MRILTWNISFLALDQDIRTYALMNIIRASAANVVCLQEVQQGPLDKLREGLDDLYPFCFESVVDATRVVILATNGDTEAARAKRRLDASGRPALHCEFPCGDTAYIRVATTHLESDRVRGRCVHQETQLEDLFGWLGELPSPPGVGKTLWGTIVCGDMNWWSAGDMQCADHGFEDAGDTPARRGGATFRGDDRSGGGTNRVDRVLFCPERGMRVSSYRLVGQAPVRETRRGKVYISDHFGVLVGFTWGL